MDDRAIRLRVCSIFRVAHNDPTTALAIFSAVNGVGAVLGVVLSEIQRLVELGLLLSVVAYMHAEYPMHQRDEREVNVLAFVTVAFWIATIAVGTWVLSVASLVLGLPFVVGRFLKPFRTKVKRDSSWMDRAYRHMPEPPESAPDSVKEWFARSRDRAERRRDQLRKEMTVYARLPIDVKDALGRRDLDEARQLLPEEFDLTDDELIDLAERVGPQREILKSNARMRSFFLFLATGFAVILALSDVPWIVPEAVTIDGSESRTAFVLSESDGRLALLWDESREVERVSADRVDRTLCEDGRLARFQTLFELVGVHSSSSDYPACPSPSAENSS